jgi:aminopeptidase N
MEYPVMVNDGDARDHNGTVYVTSHEIGHTYFPFYVGTNEQKYAWIDEGLITFFPREIVGKLTKDKNYNPFVDMVKNYNLTAGSFLEVPLMISSTNTSESYRYHAYVRSSTAFYMLRELIGKEKFNKALQEYARRWNGKHPIPQDLFATVNQVVGEDLAWFWKSWFFELGFGRFSNWRL